MTIPLNEFQCRICIRRIFHVEHEERSEPQRESTSKGQPIEDHVFLDRHCIVCSIKRRRTWTQDTDQDYKDAEKFLASKATIWLIDSVEALHPTRCKIGHLAIIQLKLYLNESQKVVTMATSISCRVSAISAFCRSTTQTPLHNQSPSRYRSHKASYSNFSPKIGCHGNVP